MCILQTWLQMSGLSRSAGLSGTFVDKLSFADHPHSALPQTFDGLFAVAAKLGAMLTCPL